MDKKAYYQVSFTGVQALVGLAGVLAALALAFFLGAKAGFEKSAAAGAAPSVVPPGESDSSATSPAPPTSTTIEGGSTSRSTSERASTRPIASPATTAATSPAATSSAALPPLEPQEAPVFEDREAGVPAEKAPSRTEIAGETSRTPSPSPSAPAKAMTAKAGTAKADAPKTAPAKEGPASPSEVRGPAASELSPSGFFVQIVSTTSKSEASRWKDRLTAKKYRAALSSVDSSKGKMYRVRLGPYPDREQARKLAEKISGEFHQKAWVAPAR